MRNYVGVMISFAICILLLIFFQMNNHKNIKEHLELISSQIEHLDEDIHILEGLISNNED